MHLTRHVFLERLLLDTETALGVQSQTGHGNGNGDLFVAGNGSRADQEHGMALSVDNGAAIVLKLQQQEVFSRGG